MKCLLMQILKTKKKEFGPPKTLLEKSEKGYLKLTHSEPGLQWEANNLFQGKKIIVYLSSCLQGEDSKEKACEALEMCQTCGTYTLDANTEPLPCQLRIYLV